MDEAGGNAPVAERRLFDSVDAEVEEMEAKAMHRTGGKGASPYDNEKGISHVEEGTVSNSASEKDL